LAGFATYNLAPALGLPPELPGSASAPLLERQLWWLFTVVFTGIGLSLIVFARRVVFKALGALLIVVPHIVGAPEPEIHGGSAPPELAKAFVYATLLANVIFWLLLGAVAGFLFKRIGCTRQ
jgi:cobalt transporter subunit CbtA